MNEKFEKLDALIAELEISDCELRKWYNKRSEKDNIIPTVLPLVYRQRYKLIVKNGLDLRCKDNLWGIQLSSGIMIALRCGAEDDVITTTWDYVRIFAQKIKFNHESGSLPALDMLKKCWDDEEKNKFKAVFDVLSENDIDADGCWGSVWCSEQYNLDCAYFFGLGGNEIGWDKKERAFIDDRVALVF